MAINCQQNNNSKTIIGERIKSARKIKKLSQAELADKLELTQGFIGHLEKGRNQPTLDQITRMAIILDCNMSWLATGEGEMRPDFTYKNKAGDIIIGEIKQVYNDKEVKPGSNIIIIDEQHRSMIELMDSAPDKKAELVALVKGYLMGEKSKKKQKSINKKPVFNPNKIKGGIKWDF
jgi:transcriptional regulator with XRE-family HTH domain